MANLQSDPWFQPGKILTSTSTEYTLAKLLGRGSYGQVFLATDKQNKKVAIKVIPVTSKSDHKYARREVETMKLTTNGPDGKGMLRNHNIVKLIETWSARANMKGFMPDHFFVFIVMEYCEYGSLDELLQKLPRESYPDIVLFGLVASQLGARFYP